MKFFNVNHLPLNLCHAYLLVMVALLNGCGGGGSDTSTSTAKVTAISVSPSNVSIGVNYNAKLNVIATYSDGKTGYITNQVSWISASPSVVSVGSNTGVLTGLTDSTGVPVVVTATINGFSATANVLVSTSGGVSHSNLNEARNDHTSSLLTTGPNAGKVLVVGGYGNTLSNSSLLNTLSSVELFDPVSNNWTTVTPLNIARGDQTSVTLNDYKILVTGGTDENNTELTSTEIYDPVTGIWSSTCDLIDGRSYNTITLLDDGSVMVAGGDTNAGTTNTVEIYFPTNPTPPGCTWTPEPPMSVPRNTPTATLLKNGKVLVTGGYDVYFNVNPGGITAVFASSELYDHYNNTWTATGSLTDARYQHTATLLQDGRVLVVGGFNLGNYPLATAELYDPATGIWTPTGSLGTARAIHTATLLPNGKVLVMGGQDATGYAITSTELYDPQTGVWTTTNSLNTARDNFTATLIPYNSVTNPNYPNGSVIAVGGYGISNMTNTTEIYWW